MSDIRNLIESEEPIESILEKVHSDSPETTARKQQLAKLKNKKSAQKLADKYKKRNEEGCKGKNLSESLEEEEWFENLWDAHESLDSYVLFGMEDAEDMESSDAQEVIGVVKKMQKSLKKIEKIARGWK